MRVGRDPIDAEAMRLLEQHNPDVTFDWPRLLKAAPAGPTAIPAARPGREERRRDRHDQRRPGREEPRPRFDAPPAPPPRAEEFPAADVESNDDETAMGALDSSEPPEPIDPLDVPEPVALDLDAAAPIASLPADEPEARGSLEPAPSSEPSTPVHEPMAAPLPERYTRLGHDGMTRLRARFVDVRARLQANVMEESERDGLLGRAERLNPDGWLSDADVSQALEEYESVFESLRPFLGRPGRPRRL